MCVKKTLSWLIFSQDLLARKFLAVDLSENNDFEDINDVLNRLVEGHE